MALIECPECNKKISETTPTCPHCGYALVAGDTMQNLRTPIGEVKYQPVKGVAAIIVGFIGIIMGFFTLTIIIGIFVLIGAFIIFGIGINGVSGVREIHCPHCRKKGEMPKNTVSYKCPICKKISVSEDGYLNPVR